ncbi:hypothetical protein J6590_030921 [Homalodisca vitripennis]|nr:hypothetical protein J6590_030921 [Homalodisca vitripennis]
MAHNLNPVGFITSKIVTSVTHFQAAPGAKRCYVATACRCSLDTFQTLGENSRNAVNRSSFFANKHPEHGSLHTLPMSYTPARFCTLSTHGTYPSKVLYTLYPWHIPQLGYVHSPPLAPTPARFSTHSTPGTYPSKVLYTLYPWHIPQLAYVHSLPIAPPQLGSLHTLPLAPTPASYRRESRTHLKIVGVLPLLPELPISSSANGSNVEEEECGEIQVDERYLSACSPPVSGRNARSARHNAGHKRLSRME